MVDKFDGETLVSMGPFVPAAATIGADGDERIRLTDNAQTDAGELDTVELHDGFLDMTGGFVIELDKKRFCCDKNAVSFRLAPPLLMGTTRCDVRRESTTLMDLASIALRAPPKTNEGAGCDGCRH